MKIIEYGAEWCPWCRKLKTFLESHKIKFEYKDVQNNPKFGEELVNLTKQNGIPVLVVGNEYVIGFDEKKIKNLLKIS